MKKLIFIIIDGMGDRPVKELNGLTPLEYASTPTMDYLSRRGINGVVTIINEEIAPETESGVLALFGYDPLKYNKGRGPIEAYGMGIDFCEGELAFRSNFVTLEGNRIVDVRAGRIDTQHAKRLTSFLEKTLKLETMNVEMRIVTTLKYRSVLIFHPKRGRLSSNVSNTHPGYEKVSAYLEIPRPLKGEKILRECRPLDNTREARITADLVNEFTRKSHKLLETHPINKKRRKEGLSVANGIVVRGPGTSLPRLDNFVGKNKKWLCIADTPAERGIAKLLGMELYEDLPEPECDRELNTYAQIEHAVMLDMEVRLKRLLEAMESYDCLYIHIKGPDPLGHRGMGREKARMIECIDEYFFKPLLEELDLNNVVLSVTSDHCTACDAHTHTSDPVPLLISGGGVDGDMVKRFGERYCRHGRLGNIHATDLMRLLMHTLKDG